MVSRPCQKLNLYFYQFLLQTVLLTTIKVNFLNSSCILIEQNFGNYIIDLEGFSNRYQFNIIKWTIAILGTLRLRVLADAIQSQDVGQKMLNANPIYAEYINRKSGSNASSLICSHIGKTSVLHSCFVKPVIKRLYSIQKNGRSF